MNDSLALPFTYATASAEAAAALVAVRYDLRPPLDCALLHRGFNDVYHVGTAAEERFVLRLSGHRARGGGDGRTAEWGRELLSAEWLEREVAFLLAWERDKLFPGLL